MDSVIVGKMIYAWAIVFLTIWVIPKLFRLGMIGGAALIVVVVVMGGIGVMSDQVSNILPAIASFSAEVVRIGAKLIAFVFSDIRFMFAGAIGLVTGIYATSR